MFASESLKEANEMFHKSSLSLADNLEEAAVHECGHARLIKGMSAEQIQELYAELDKIHIDGISKTAKIDGAECIAEVEVLLMTSH